MRISLAVDELIQIFQVSFEIVKQVIRLTNILIDKFLTKLPSKIKSISGQFISSFPVFKNLLLVIGVTNYAVKSFSEVHHFIDGLFENLINFHCYSWVEIH